MYEEIYRKCPNAKRVFGENREYILYFLLGKRIPLMDENECYAMSLAYIWFT